MAVLVGKPAPDFTVPAVLADGTIVENYSFSAATKGKYALVFFYPLDFLIDPEGVVRSQIVNDLPLGRSMDEILRLFDALQFHTEHGEVCPANWKKGDKGMDASPEGVAKYLSENADKL